MGCDIHLYREKKTGDKWIAADEWAESEVAYEKRAFTGRNYELFGALSAGVRAEVPFAFEPRGIPINVSDEVRKSYADWGSDGHSHSYLYLHELRDFRSFLDNETIKIEGMKDRSGLAALNESIASGSPNWDLIYPYCGHTNNKDFTEFEIEVPASYYIGGCVDTIISSFDGIDGENHRIVFWFDN